MPNIKQQSIISKIDNSLHWHKIFQLGIFVRLLLFATVFWLPIPYGPSPPISPLHYQTGVDLGEYLQNISFYSSYQGLRELFQIFTDFYIEQNYPKQR